MGNGITLCIVLNLDFPNLLPHARVLLNRFSFHCRQIVVIKMCWNTLLLTVNDEFLL